jgi:hypothetical protein
LLLAVAFLASACDDGGPKPRPVPKETICRIALETPAEFRPAGRQRIPDTNRVAVRETYRSSRGQTLTLFAGVRGEFGEGMRFYGRVSRETGTARLYGKGSNWVLIWRSPGPCGPRAVIGERFSRAGFLDVLRAMNAIVA